MTIHAYQEMYVSKAQNRLGVAFDYAINICHFTKEEFVDMLVVSPITKRLENGELPLILGKSGIEILIEILYSVGKERDIEVIPRYSRSVEYWIGWAVAYYQWYSSRSYREIFEAISFEEFQILYKTLHEADITKFVEIVDTRLKDYYKETNLKRNRTLYGYTQEELSKKSGVSLRSIQMYEQRNKNINKASAESLYRISKALYCTIEDLLEK